MKIAIVSDEISQDFETAVVLGREWGITDFEIRSVYLNRVPDITDRVKDIIRRIVDQYEVHISSISPGLFKIPLQQELIDQHMKERLPCSFDLARFVGTNKILIFGFIKPEGADSRGYPSQMIDILEKAAERAEEEGMLLLLENEPICWADTSYVTSEIIDRVGKRSLKLNWDPCNAFTAGERNPYPDGYTVIKQNVAHVHIKDAVVLPDGKYKYVNLGEGEIDWPGQLRALSESGYDGYCVVETHFGPGVLTSKRCAENLKEILKQVGSTH